MWNPHLWMVYLLLICYIAIENCHRNSGFTHEKWWIFPLLCDSLPEGSVYCLFILVAIQTKLAVFIELQAGS